MFDRFYRKVAARRAQHGALWLDEKQAGWYRRVNLRTLSMVRCDRCVLAQVTRASYSLGRLSLGLSHVPKTVTMGFYTHRPWFYRFLDEAWKREVLVRRRRDQQATLDECKRIVDGWVHDRTTITN